MQTQQGDTPFETFNKRFDALFGQDCRDSDGRLHHIRQGKNGMGLICAYLNSIKWTSDIPLDLVEIKLLRLSTELRHLRYALNTLSSVYMINIQVSRGSDEDLVLSTRPSRHVIPTSRLTNTDNTEQAQLSFQRKAVEDFRTRQNAMATSEPSAIQSAEPTPSPPQSPATSTLLPSQSIEAPSLSWAPPPPLADFLPEAQNSASTSTLKRSLSSVINIDDKDDDEDVSIQPKPCTSF